MGDNSTESTSLWVCAGRAGPGQCPSAGGSVGCRRLPGSQGLAGEERLGLPAHGVDAERAAQGQLAGAHLVGLQVGAHQVCQGLQGGWQWSEGANPAVQSPRPSPGTGLPSLCPLLTKTHQLRYQKPLCARQIRYKGFHFCS